MLRGCLEARFILINQLLQHDPVAVSGVEGGQYLESRGPFNSYLGKEMKRCSKRKKGTMIKTETQNRKKHQHQLSLPPDQKKIVCSSSDVAYVDRKREMHDRAPAREKKRKKKKKKRKEKKRERKREITTYMTSCLKTCNESAPRSLSAARSRPNPRMKMT